MVQSVIDDLLRQPLLSKHFQGTPRVVKTLTGGCTSQAVHVRDDHNEYFLKLHHNGRDMLQGEMQSLQCISRAVPGFCARPICTGADDHGTAYLLTTFLDLGRTARSLPDIGPILGHRLAQLHQTSSPTGKYGFHYSTWCGSTPLDNSWNESWLDFWITQRWKPILRLCQDEELEKMGMRLIAMMPEMFAGADVRPVLLHGDLWSGNWGVDEVAGQPVLFDPAAFYGHDEFELGIMGMFGGFPETAYAEYYQYIPKGTGQEERVAMYECWHHLNHYVLFGGGYRESALGILTRLLRGG